MRRYRLVGGPSDGTFITFPPDKIPVQRYLYLNGSMYWISKQVVDEQGFVVLEWDGNE